MTHSISEQTPRHHSRRGSRPPSRGAGERRVDRFAVRQLTVALTAACHAARRMNELKFAPDMLAFWIGKIGDNEPAVVSDKGRAGVPVIPPSKTRRRRSHRPTWHTWFRSRHRSSSNQSERGWCPRPSYRSPCPSTCNRRRAGAPTESIGSSASVLS